MDGALAHTNIADVADLDCTMEVYDKARGAKLTWRNDRSNWSKDPVQMMRVL